MRVVSLNIGMPQIVVHGGRRYSSAINRRPVVEPVQLTTTGFVGDRVADAQDHGGPDKAACCYPHEHFAYWQGPLGHELSPAAFGENLTTSGLLEEVVCIGDSFRIGRARVQVSQPRRPCWKLANKHGTPDLIRWVNDTGYTGFYVRVLEPGPVAAGDDITLLDHPYPDATVAWAMRTILSAPPDDEALERLTSLPPLAAAWRRQIARKRSGR